MKPEDILELDPLIHAPVRLAILTALMTVESARFTFLREAVGTTDGNLTTHLSRLEQNGYISIRKRFKGKKPQTLCTMTAKGRKAFRGYLGQLAQLVEDQKK